MPRRADREILQADRAFRRLKNQRRFPRRVEVGDRRLLQKHPARFEIGLRQLERIESPIVVGDIPDATAATGGILGKEEMPAPETIERCNGRLKSWAAGRKDVTIFPIARLMAGAAANEEVVVAGTTWETGKSGALVRKDRLHPSRHALAASPVKKNNGQDLHD